MKHLEVKYIKNIDKFRVKIGRNEAPVTLSREEILELRASIWKEVTENMYDIKDQDYI